MDINKNGNLYFFWIDYQSGLGHFSKSIDGGATFSDIPLWLITTMVMTLISKTSICVDEWNGVYVTWTDNRNGNQDVFLSISRDGGQTFSDAIQVNDDSTSTDQRNPSMCCDEVGNLFIAWEDDRDEETNIYYTKVDAMDHSPRIVGDLPTTFNMIEDQVLTDPLVSLDDYFEDDDDDENLSFEVKDSLTPSKFTPRIENGDLYFDPSEEDLFGTFEFKLRAVDPGEDGIPGTGDDVNSAWIDIELIVEPVDDPPKVIGDLSNPFESGEIRIDVKEGQWYNSTLRFKEVDGEEITITTTEDHPRFEFNTYDGNFSFHPDNQDVGEMRFLITLMDENLSSTEVWLVFNVSNENDGPIALESFLNRTMDEDQVLSGIDVSLWFMDPDEDELEYSVEDSEHVTGTIQWSLLTISPASNWSGKETIKVLCNDSILSAYVDIMITVDPVNDPPSDIEVNLPQGKFKEGGDQKISVSAEDNEDSSQELTYSWYEGEKLLGTGPSIDLGLSEGTHLITLKVSDLSGGESSRSFTVEVEGGEDDSFPVMILIIIIVLVIFLIVLIGIILFIVRSKEQPSEEEESKDEIDLLLEQETEIPQ